jgi:hypothetical protein
LLPAAEEDYILNAQVKAAMARAKEVGGKLFEDMTFYVTPKVPVEVKLLKNVVAAQGGKVGV